MWCSWSQNSFFYVFLIHAIIMYILLCKLMPRWWTNDSLASLLSLLHFKMILLLSLKQFVDLEIYFLFFSLWQGGSMRPLQSALSTLWDINTLARGTKIVFPSFFPQRYCNHTQIETRKTTALYFSLGNGTHSARM